MIPESDRPKMGENSRRGNDDERVSNAIPESWSDHRKTCGWAGVAPSCPICELVTKPVELALERDWKRGKLAWCIRLVKDNPDWRLSCQQHKAWGVR